MASALLVVTGVLLGDSWWQLLVAAAFGIVMAQFGFVAHEASHRQVLRSGPGNDRLGLVLGNAVVGIDFDWWKAGHVRHHAHPNVVDADPSIRLGAFAFTAEDARSTRGLYARYVANQSVLLFPLLLLAGVNLYVKSVIAAVGAARHGGVSRLVLLLLRNGGFLAVAFAALPVGKAAAFVAVEVAVFGLATAAAFVPNHVGMPIVAAGSELDFLRRQVITSRNIRGRASTWWMGGLEFQIEHHLFPSMPRPNLAPAGAIVRRHCERLGVVYTSQSLVEAYGEVLRELHDVGVVATERRTGCPVAARYGR
ncbi:acyl-CoA desaturase [Cnuibacter sp. UC19_7]|uniref:acyl-CoA desaturase n=1 Tax=Cnuibacter sp. UC19_7 TaxID=3350166 RepID=UPI00366E5F3A